jgi:hypothetical protein
MDGRSESVPGFGLPRWLNGKQEHYHRRFFPATAKSDPDGRPVTAPNHSNRVKKAFLAAGLVTAKICHYGRKQTPQAMTINCDASVQQVNEKGNWSTASTVQRDTYTHFNGPTTLAK